MIRTIVTLALSAAAPPALAADPLVSPAELAGMLDDPSVAIIDVRSPMETASENAYAEGHIPGAVAAPYKKAGWRAKVDGVPGQLPPVDQIGAMIAGLGVDADDHVVIYAAGHGPKALDMGIATRVYWTFKTLGHDNVSLLDGGWKAWTDAGLPTSTEASAPATGDFVAVLRPSLYATASHAALGMTGDVDLVDTRPAAFYAGTKKSGIVARAGAIPGAVSFPVGAMLDAEGAHFRPVDELRATLAEIGVDPRDTQVMYCNSGHHGAIGWFVMHELLGDRSVSLYDGSMADWAADPKRPAMPGTGPAVGG